MLELSESTVYTSVDDFTRRFVTVDDTTASDVLDRQTSKASETISSNANDQTVFLGSGNDLVTVNGTNDTAIAGSGNSQLNVSDSGANLLSGMGQDIITYQPGSGSLTVDEATASGSAPAIVVETQNVSPSSLDYSTVHFGPQSFAGHVNDELTFGAGVSSDDLSLSSSGYNLELNDGQETITLNGELNPIAQKTIGQFAFNDGTSLTLSDLLSRGVSVSQLADNAVVNRQFATWDETITATGSNDVIILGHGNDTVTAGDDATILLGAGNNEINVGSGTTLIYDAQATPVSITETSGVPSLNASVSSYIGSTIGTATINVDGVASSADISAYSTGSSTDLILAEDGSNDSIVLKDALRSLTPASAEAFVFQDASSLTLEGLLQGQISVVGTDNGEIINRQASAVSEHIHAEGDSEVITAGGANDLITVTGSGDTINASSGQSTIDIDGQSAIVNVGAGNDVINVSSNNATIHEGIGVATIDFNEGSGTLHIVTQGQTNATSDTLSLTGSDLVANNLIATSTGSSTDLHLAFSGTNDQIIISGGLGSNGKNVGTVQFDDDSTVNLRSLTVGVTDTGNHDVIDRSDSLANENIQASGDNQTILAGSGNDTIVASGHSDSIATGSGSDTVTLGTGAITVNSGSGAATFLFNQTNSQVAISEAASSGNQDTLSFGDQLSENDLTLSSIGSSSDLILNFASSNDQIALGSQLSASHGKSVTDFQFADGSSLHLTDLLAETVTVIDTPGVSTLDRSGSIANELITVTGDNRTVKAGSGDDVIDATGNSDVIYAGAGNDQITIGTGTTQVFGGAGASTYEFNQQNSILDITESSQSPHNDSITFGSDISANDLSVYSQGSDPDLVLAFSNRNDEVVLKNALTGNQNKTVQNFNFADGTTLSLSDLLAEPLLVSDGTTNDIIDRRLSVVDETIEATGQNQTIYGGAGNDTIDATSGNDTVVIDTGNDTISAGPGSTTIRAGAGVATISFDSGDGQFLIDERTAPPATSGNDILAFGAGITADSLSLSTTTNSPDLIIDIEGTNDQIRIDGELALHPSKFVDAFQFADSTSLTLDQLLNGPLTVADSATADSIDRSQSRVNEIIQASGNDQTITAGAGNDTIYAQSGNDTVNTGSGNDTVYAGSGTTRINSGTGNGSFIFSQGNGTFDIAHSVVPGGSDNVYLGEGLSSDDITLTSDGSNADLIVNFVSNDSLIFRQALTANPGKSTTLNFFDGTSETVSSLWQANSVGVTATADNATIDRRASYANEQIEATGQNQVIYAGAGNDTISASGNNDVIIVGTGNDSISTTAGLTSIHAGAGVATINVASNNGTIMMQEGGTPGLNDVLSFGEGLSSSDLELSSQGSSDSLVVGFDGNQEQVIISGELAGPGTKKVGTFDFADGTSLTLHQLLQENVVYVSDSVNNDTINRQPSAANENISATGNSQIIRAGSGDDVISAASGNDTVYTGSGNDTVTIGAGHTIIYAGSGSATYDYEASDGTLEVYESSTGSNDTLSFGSGIDSSSLTLSSSGSSADLSISIGNPNDSVIIHNGIAINSGKQIGSFAFADGSELSLSSLLDRQVTIDESAAGKTIDRRNSFANENIDATGTSQTIYAGSGNDVIQASSGTDTIFACSGNDSIEIGAGRTDIYAGTGQGTYHFDAADGQLVIHEDAAHGTVRGNDTLSFGYGISSSNLSLSADGSSLKLHFSGSNDSVIIQGELAPNAAKTVSELDFADGSTVQVSALLQQSMAISDDQDGDTIDQSIFSGDRTITATGANQTIYASSGNDTISSSGAGATIYAGAGTDNIVATGNNDYIYAGSGTSTISASGDNNIIHAGAGTGEIAVAGNNDIVDGGSGTAEVQGGSSSLTVNSGSGALQVDFTTSSGNYDVYETSSNSSASDSVNFGAGLLLNRLNLYATGNDLTLQFANSAGQLVLHDELNTALGKKVSEFTFANGTTLSLDELLERGVTVVDNGSHDTIDRQSSDLNERIQAGGVQQTIYAGSGNDIISAADGNDIIQTGSGNDVVTVGAGSTLIRAGAGTSTFFFNQLNNTFDIRENFSSSSSNDDILSFGAGFTAQSISLTSTGYNLTLNFPDQTHQVTLEGELDPNESKYVNQFYFSDGTSLSRNDLLQRGLTVSDSVSHDTIDRSFSWVNEHIIASGNDQTITAGSGNDTIDATGLNDTITAGTGNDVINVGGGNDTVYAGSGVDTITAGAGHSVLYGGSGSATYVFNQGDGSYYIRENTSPAGAGGNDTLQFGTGISVDNLLLSSHLSNPDLTINFQGSTDVVTLESELHPGAPKNIGTFKFADGTTLSLSQLLQQLPVSVVDNVHGDQLDRSFSAANEHIQATGGNQDISLGYGNDVVSVSGSGSSVTAGSGNDVITAGSGDYTISAGSGHDTITAGPGNSLIFGGSGDSTFDFNQGNGSYDIRENVSPGTSGGNDTLSFGAGISQSSLLLSSHGSNADLTIDLSGSNDEVLIETELSPSANKTIGHFTFANGNDLSLSSLTATGVNVVDMGSGDVINRQFSSVNENITTQGSSGTVYAGSGNDVISSAGSHETIYAGSGTDVINASGQADVIWAGSGNDTINASGTNDTITAGAGNDSINLGSGNATVYLGSGSDSVSASGAVNALIIGGSGDSTLNFDQGNGTYDIRENTSPSATGGNDTLNFGAGIAANSLLLVSHGSNADLAIDFSGSNDQVLIETELSPTASKYVGTFDFADGTSLTEAQLLQAGVTVVDTTAGEIIDRRFSAVNETIESTANTQTVYAGSGNDTVDVTVGNDTITLGSGTDVVNATSNNTINAGSGNDTVNLTGGGNTVNAGSGNDVIYAGAGTNTIYASTGGSTIYSGVGNTVVWEGSGNSNLEFASGDGTLTVHERTAPSQTGGNDTLTLATGIAQNDLSLTSAVGTNDLTINFQGSTDKVTLESQLVASPTKQVGHFDFADNSSLTLAQLLLKGVTVSDSTASDAIDRRGSIANETIQASGTSQTIYTGSGNDTVNASGASAVIHLSSGTDAVSAFGGHDTIYGGTGSDSITSTGGHDVITAGSGDATITASGGNDTITAGSGNDVISAGGSGNMIYAGSGADTISGTGSSVMYGGSGDSTYVFDSGNGSYDIRENTAPAISGHSDKLSFGTGISSNSLILVSHGSNADLTIELPSSNDQIMMETELSSTAAKYVGEFDFADGTNLTKSQLLQAGITVVDSTVSDVIDRRFSSLNETIQSTGNGQTVWTGSGNDSVSATVGNDTINLSSGVDSATATSNNTINAGSGNDTITLSGSGNVVNAGSGVDVITAGTGTNTINLGSGAATVNAGVGNTVIWGGSADSTINFAKGDGSLTVHETTSPAVSGGNDSLVFGSGISTSNLLLSINGGNLDIAFNNSSDQIVLSNEMDTSPAKLLKHFNFADGTQLSLSQLLALGLTINSTANSDSIDQSAITYNEVISASGSGDNIKIGSGTTTVNDTGGNDTITAGSGNDTINAGAGTKYPSDSGRGSARAVRMISLSASAGSAKGLEKLNIQGVWGNGDTGT